MTTNRLHRIAFSALAFAACAGFASAASAQVGGSFGWNSNNGAQGNTYGNNNNGGYNNGPPQTGQGTGYQASTDLEIGTLYVTAAAYGAGTGIWIDAEAGVTDPGLRFIAPGILGVAMPIGVYFLDQPTHMQRGVPAAITLGLTLGAGEGLGIWAYQFTSSTSDNEWGFKELARSTFIGSTAGGVAGAVLGFTQEPSPKTSLLIGSTAVWGAGIGSMFGYGASSSVGNGYGDHNESASLGGMIGYNAGIIGSAAISAVWVPTYKQMAWMWMGAAAGFAVTLPVYLFYADSDAPAKRGLIVQGVGTTLGIAAGAIFTLNDKSDIAEGDDPFKGSRPRWAQLTGIGMMPVRGGAGAQLSGVLF